MSELMRTFFVLAPLVAISAIAIFFLRPIRKANQAQDRRLALRSFLGFCLSLLALIALLALVPRFLTPN